MLDLVKAGTSRSLAALALDRQYRTLTISSHFKPSIKGNNSAFEAQYGNCGL